MWRLNRRERYVKYAVEQLSILQNFDLQGFGNIPTWRQGCGDNELR